MSDLLGWNGHICRVCGAKVVNHNPKATICSDSLCHDADENKITREEAAIRFASLPFPPQEEECFAGDSDENDPLYEEDEDEDGK